MTNQRLRQEANDLGDHVNRVLLYDGESLGVGRKAQASAARIIRTSPASMLETYPPAPTTPCTLISVAQHLVPASSGKEYKRFHG